jgi:hypothetical protein
MMRAAIVAAVLLAAGCRDDDVNIELVFPDTTTASAAKTVVLEVGHNDNGAATCAAPPGALILKQTVTLPAPSTAIARSQIPTGPVVFLATAFDGQQNTLASGCTEAENASGENLQVLIELQKN